MRGDVAALAWTARRTTIGTSTGQMLSALSFIMSRNVLALRAASSDQGHFLAFAAVRTRTFAEQSSPQSKACRHRHALVGSGMGSGGLCCLRHPRPFYAPPAPRGPLPRHRSGCCSPPAATLASSGLRATGRDRPLAQSSVCMALKEGIGMAVRRPSWLWSRRHLGRARVKSLTTNGFLVTYYTSFTLVAELIRIKLNRWALELSRCRRDLDSRACDYGVILI